MKTNQLPLILIMITTLLLSGCVNENTTGNNPTSGNQNMPSTGKFVAGATCEIDEDCVYALNAYPIQKCISANCPPPEAEQPEPGNPAYEWTDAYLDECVNNTQLNGTNMQGEPLQIDKRNANCACEAVNLPGTSIDGQKICRKKIVETIPEDSGI
ncbi:MAG: hypothetical protein FJY86_01250 [Candidatus Diapherotrites archaeon]|uniref:Lipoprotein n=1 Tax=Candidatus Iainarchaeum sp. TaxID=3101447 RepID=A0A8T4C646_9ARCH|nr:hypothetical protein [Candidatus Diapherotrites archaeon]